MKTDKTQITPIASEPSMEDLDAIAEKAGQAATREAEKAAAAGAPWAASSEAELTLGNRPRVVIETGKGNIIFEMFADKAPETVQNFAKLANKGFYNGIKWHLVLPGQAILGGDPLTKDADPKNDGNGGPGYTIKTELSDIKTAQGTVGMAPLEGSKSAGSQFYICLAPQSNLDGKTTIFGQVVEGLDVLEKIEQGDAMTKVYIEQQE